MCGIIFVERRNECLANSMVLKRFEKQRQRGTDGFGYISINDGIVRKTVRAEDEKDIIPKLAKEKDKCILFHHRYPTSTPNLKEATHPITVSHPSLKFDYHVVHNGVISNPDELKKNHLKLGFIYTTRIVTETKTISTIYSEECYNDSEAFAIDFALSLENDKEIKSSGSIAFIALQVNKETKKVNRVYYGRNYGNPLKVEEDKTYFCLSSETGTLIDANILHCYDMENRTTTMKAKKIGIYHDYSSYYGGGNIHNSCSVYKDDYDDDFPNYRMPRIGQEFMNNEDDGYDDDFLDVEMQALEDFYDADPYLVKQMTQDELTELQSYKDEIQRLNREMNYDEMTDKELEKDDFLFQVAERIRVENEEADKNGCLKKDKKKTKKIGF
jgi:predicted glutamine amidotransferase